MRYEVLAAGADVVTVAASVEVPVDGAPYARPRPPHRPALSMALSIRSGWIWCANLAPGPGWTCRLSGLGRKFVGGYSVARRWGR